jgi:hypothetical protein
LQHERDRSGLEISCAITHEAALANLLIRNIPDDVLDAIDANARRLGLSRVEYLRRALARERARIGHPVTTRDLARFSRDFADLADPDVMRRAWE